MKRINFIVCFILLTNGLIAQSYYIGLNPPSIQWKYIETDAAKIIYQEGIYSQAARIANVIQRLSDSSYFSLGSKKEQVSIILQNQSITPNAFVGVGPFRSEFYTNPPQNNFAGAVDWNDLLAIHEYRHVQQLQNARIGVVNAAYKVFGDYFWSSMAHLIMPPWFFEGDAVFTETVLSNAGRGRMPYFEGQYRAMLLTGTALNYEKNSAGSYKKLIPNIYNMGYHLTASLNRDYGEDIMGNLLQEAVKSSLFNFYPFSKSLKNHTGMRTPKYYEATFSKLKKEWEQKAEKIELTEAETVNNKVKKTFTSYAHPNYLDTQTLIAEKAGFNEIPTFYRIQTDGSEKRITSPGFYSPSNANLSLSKAFLVWTEKAYDPRWGNVEYSNVIKFDHTLQLKKQLTFKARYFVPEINKDGDKIVAVHAPANQEYELHILNAQSGNLDKKINNEEQYQYAFPTWVDETSIATVVRKSGKNAIQIIHLGTGKSRLITPWWSEKIAHLKSHQNYIYFDGIFNGIDNIYALSMQDQRVYQVTSTLFGAVQPGISPDGKMLAYSAYSYMGYDIQTTPLIKENWKPMESIENSLVDYFEPMYKDNILENINEQSYEEQPYPTTDRLQLHSRLLAYVPPNLLVNVYADNKMSNLSGIGAYRFNLNEKSSSWSAGLQWAKYYPILKLETALENRNSYVPVYFETEKNDEITPNLETRNQNWTENKVGLGLRLPFNLTLGNFHNFIEINQNFRQHWVNYALEETGKDGSFASYELDIRMRFTLRQAYQHINPRLGVLFQSNYQKSMGITPNTSHAFLINSRLYLPGIFKNHSFYAEIDHHSEPFTAQYKFLDNFRYPRGYGKLIHDEINRMGLNYAFPICYPDLAIGPLFFIKRIKANLFYDHSRVILNNTSIDDLTPLSPVTFNGSVPYAEDVYESAGIELTFDVRTFRLVDFDLGLRFSYPLNTNQYSNKVEFILSSISF